MIKVCYLREDGFQFKRLGVRAYHDEGAAADGLDAAARPLYLHLHDRAHVALAAALGRADVPAGLLRGAAGAGGGGGSGGSGVGPLADGGAVADGAGRELGEEGVVQGGAPDDAQLFACARGPS